MAQLAIEKERLRIRKNKLAQQEQVEQTANPVEDVINQPQQQQQSKSRS
jgi:hypothetical protein